MSKSTRTTQFAQISEASNQPYHALKQSIIRQSRDRLRQMRDALNLLAKHDKRTMQEVMDARKVNHW